MHIFRAVGHRVLIRQRARSVSARLLSSRRDEDRIVDFAERNPQSSDTAARIQFARAIPDGDDKERDVCQRCGFVAYDNPKVVAGAVLFADDGAAGDGDGRRDDGVPRILLGQRDIPPRRGTWGHPAGFLELGEGADAGAAREAREELCVDVNPAALSPLAVYSIPAFGQVHTYFVGVLDGDTAGRAKAGHETQQAAWVWMDELDWDDLAFPTSVLALADALEWRAAMGFGVSTGPHDAPRAFSAVHRTVGEAMGSPAVDVLAAHGLDPGNYLPQV